VELELENKMRKWIKIRCEVRQNTSIPGNVSSLGLFWPVASILVQKKANLKKSIGKKSFKPEFLQ